ncbi:MAG: hypothetical protein AAF358_09340 [Pseudomonadota bacterium]
MLFDKLVADSNGLELALYQALEESTFSGSQEQTRTCSKPRFVTSLKKHWYYRNPYNSFASSPDFSRYSGSLFFVSQKNADVTNLFYIELANLINKHSRHTADCRISIKCYTDIEIADLIDKAAGIDEFFFSDINIDSSKEALGYVEKCTEFVQRFLRLYRDTLEKSVVFDRYFCSGLIHFPETLFCDVRKVFAECGYAHSAGIPLIYRNSSKMFGGDVYRAFEKFLDGFSPEDDKNKMLVNVLSESTISQKRKKGSVLSTRNGLAELQIDLRKYYIEDVPLVSVMADLGAKHRSKVVIPVPGDDEELDVECRSDCSVWMINDFDIYLDTTSNRFGKGTKQYLGIYAQYFKNGTPLNIFKERKPGWIAPITIPTTLSSAIINSCEIQLREEAQTGGEGLVILDPFAGSGGFLMDALVRFPRAKIIGLDKNIIAPYMARDNIRFFGNIEKMSQAKGLLNLAMICSKIREADENLAPDRILESYDSEAIKDPTAYPTQFAINEINRSLDFLGEAHDGREFAAKIADLSEAGGPRSLFEFLSSDDEELLSIRLFVYAIWRGIYLNATSIAQHPERLASLLESEMTALIRELNKATGLADEGDLHHLEPSLFSLSKKTDSKQIFSSYTTIAQSQIQKYSCFRIASPQDSCEAENIIREFVSSPESGILYVSVEDSLDVLARMKQFADLIIGDPPYGFNTSEGGNAGMIDLFSKLFPTLIDATKDGGEVAAAIPLQARHGRQFPYFQTNEFIEDQIMRFLADTGRAARWAAAPFGAVNSSQGFGHAYWSSASALVRGVLNIKLGAPRSL